MQFEKFVISCRCGRKITENDIDLKDTMLRCPSCLQIQCGVLSLTRKREYDSRNNKQCKQSI